MQVETQGPCASITGPAPRAFRGAQVLVLEVAQGGLTVEYHGRPLAYTRYQQQVRQAEEVSSKGLASAVDAAQQKQQLTKPAADHPWRRYGTSLSQGDAAGRAAPWPSGPARGRELRARGTFLFWVDTSTFRNCLPGTPCYTAHGLKHSPTGPDTEPDAHL